MKTLKAFKYRIYPNPSQKKLLEKQFGAVRFVYNTFLRRHIEHYEQTGKGIGFYEQCKELTLLKNQPEYVWLKESNSQSLQYALKSLDVAYNNFFNKRAKFPSFKKKRSRQSFKVPQNFSVEGDTLKLPKIGKIPIVLSRSIQGETTNVTISMTPAGHYFASFQCEVNLPDPEYFGDTIGVDFGLKDFVTDSNGMKVEHPKTLKRSLKSMKRLQKQVSKKKKGSHNRAKAVKRLAVKHEQVANQRNDFLHKLSHKMVVENQAVILEDLSLKNMVKNHCLAQALSDSGWSEFVRQLEYKGKWYGCSVHHVDRWFPSSKRCHKCGWINESLTLKDRHWQCAECKTTHDRDHNAAQNILLFGRVGHTQTSASKTLGESV